MAFFPLISRSLMKKKMKNSRASSIIMADTKFNPLLQLVV